MLLDIRRKGSNFISFVMLCLSVKGLPQRDDSYLSELEKVSMDREEHEFV